MIPWAATKLEHGGWNFTWDASSSSGGSAGYDIWLQGRLLSTVTEEEYECLEPDYVDTPPPLEIVVEGEAAENDLYPPFAVLQWFGVSTASAYIVEELVGISWLLRSTVLEIGSGYYAMQTFLLADCTAASWRVRPVDSQGNAGTALTSTFTVVRNPDPPVVDAQYAAGIITISEV